MGKAIAFAFLYGLSLYWVYWRGFAKGICYTFRRIVSNLVKYQGMEEEHARHYVGQIGAPERRDDV